jgi:3-hydroxyisobutyrate dehydrogenase-like beta-hydroxyacid dehydrogenase
MTDVTVLGLGTMGSALARALVAARHQTTVWNRNPAKAAPLVHQGALLAETVHQAINASPLIIVCVDNYATTRALLFERDVSASLTGRTVVQLSTGSPREAREAQARFAECGTDYLDGAIMVYPDEISRRDAMILLSGPEAIYHRSKSLLGALAGDLRYLGNSIGAAAALDMALLTYGLGTIIGVVQGALICESEGVSVAEYGAMFGEQRSLLMGKRAQQRTQRIHDDNFSDTGASLAVWGSAVMSILAHCRERGLKAEFLVLLSKLFEEAETAGLGQFDVAVLSKVLRSAALDTPAIDI